MTSGDRSKANSSDLVPLADRLRFMRIFRVIAVGFIAGLALLAPDLLDADRGMLAQVTAGYVAIALLAEGLWRLWRRRGIGLFGLILIFDAVYLAWLTYFTGYLESPLRALILLHLIAVALLGSYRTGMKLTMWHSMLLLSVYYAEEAEVLLPAGTSATVPETQFQELMVFIAVMWLVAIVTASFSAVNERELRRRRYDLEALAALAAELESAQSPEVVAEVLADGVADTFAFSRVAVFGHTDGEVTLLAKFGGDVEAERRSNETMVPPPGSVMATVLERRETLLIGGLHSVIDRQLVRHFEADGNYVVVPLTAEGKAIGVLVAQHSLRSGSRVERRVVSTLERFTSQAALALRGARLLEQVQHMAATDGLTLIANRRTFEDALVREIARAGRQRHVSLLMIDIDRFKMLNDVHGHPTGDQVLREVAQILTEQCREFDTAARYGGEEFAVVLPSCTADEAARLGDQIRMTVAAGTTVSVTVSVGVGTFPENGRDAESLVRAVDQALYEAKHQGRNRVVAVGALSSHSSVIDAPAATATDDVTGLF